MIRAYRSVVVIALAMVVAGCGYALAGKTNNLPDYIKTIGVPTFQNLTPYPDLDRRFTEAVRSELASRRKYAVVPDATGVDAVLTISLQSLTAQATAFTPDTKLASSYALTVNLSGEFKFVKDDKVHWSKPSLRLVEDYVVPAGVGAQDLASLFVQVPNAVVRVAKRLAEILVPQILSAW